MEPLKLTFLLPCAAVCLLSLSAEERVNPGAALVQEFQKQIADYLKVRKTVESKLPALKPTDSQAAIDQSQHALARGIREARAQAKQGDIFTPEISAEFRRLIGIAMQGQRSKQVKDSLKSAEPVQLRLHVGDVYPSVVPLQSTPPTLLSNLPALPPELDYRIVDHDLVLRDAKANVIIDFMTKAIP